MMKLRYAIIVFVVAIGLCSCERASIDRLVKNDTEMKELYFQCLDFWEEGYFHGCEECADSVNQRLVDMRQLFLERTQGMDSIKSKRVYFRYIDEQIEWEHEWGHKKLAPLFVW